MMVWTDVMFHAIYVGNFNGSNISSVITTDITTPGDHNIQIIRLRNSTCISFSLIPSLIDGIAWDWCNKKLYWTDAADKDIEVYDPIHQHRKKLIQKGTAAIPRAIVLDPANKYKFHDHNNIITNIILL